MAVMTIAAIILVYIGIFLMEAAPLLRSKQKKLLFLYSFLLGFSFLLSMLQGFDIKIPSPSPVIKEIASSVLKSIGGR